MESFYRIAEMEALLPSATDCADRPDRLTDCGTERPTGNRSHFSQLRPRDSSCGSAQTRGNLLLAGLGQINHITFSWERAEGFLIHLTYKMIANCVNKLLSFAPLWFADRAISVHNKNKSERAEPF